MRALVMRLLPGRLRRSIRRRLGEPRPAVGWVRFGSLRRLTPISRTFGFDRGLPIDRYYVERFLARYAGAEEYGVGDIRGHVLEIGDDMYTRRFGGRGVEEEPGAASQSSAVEKVDVFHIGDENPQATIVGDLTSAEHVPSDEFDCVICTQTLHVIYDVRSAIRTLHRVLKPGGVLLATFPGISQSCRPDKDLWGDYWRFTTRSARLLFEEVFPPANLAVEAHGNVLATIAFLHGLAAGELRSEELDLRDPDYELLISVRGVKPGADDGR